MASVSLRFHPAASRVRVRELAGAAERAVESSGTADVVSLIGAALDESDPEHAVDPESLAAADRDRILATIYQITFSPRIESTVHCSGCGCLFDLDFRLDALASALDGAASGTVQPCGGGTFRTSAGVKFRLPSAAEEIEAAALSSQEAARRLAEKCLLEFSGPAPELEELERAMEEAAPALDLDLDARCPECGARQPVHFDMQSYLLSALLQERPRLWREVHRIAAAYHWSLEQILALPRSERRELVELIETESTARRRTTV